MSAYHAPQPPAKSCWLGKPALERQQWTGSFYINHPAAQHILEHFIAKLQHCELTSRYDAMLVLGGTGGGKTTLCEQMRAYATAVYGRIDPERTICPVVQFAVPDPCTPLEFAVSILRSLGDPHPRSRRYKADTIDAASRLLRECDVRLVLIDNTQDIPARRAARGVELVGARLREFIDASKALWVFLGTDDALKVVHSDPQLIKRICYRGRLPYFQIDDERSRKNFRMLLRKIDEWLPLAEPSCLCDSTVAGAVHIATEGIFDRLVQLVDRGWFEAWSKNREIMSTEDLAQAFTFVYGPESSKANPFLPEFVRRRLRERDEPFEVLRGCL